MSRIVLAGLLVVAGINLFSWSEAPVEKNVRPFDISELLISERWQEAAPIFLAENFENLEVKNVGSEQELGFSFQRELVSGYGDYQVNRDAPIKLLDLSADAKEPLEQSSKYEIEPFCDINPNSKYCNLVIAWDEDVSDSAVFIGAQTGPASFALIEQELLEKLR